MTYSLSFTQVENTDSLERNGWGQKVKGERETGPKGGWKW